MERTADRTPTFAQLVGYFLKLGATAFGGPVALANYLRTDLVERDAWFTEEEYDRGLAARRRVRDRSRISSASIAAT